jgi:DNA-binding transcriptional MerR regulator
MTPKLYKAAEVCEIAQLQPYVLRSWEKEFPGIGVQKSDDSPRFYRQSDIDHVLRIKQLVFGEGLTLAGARRRLEGAVLAPPRPSPALVVEPDDPAEVLDVLGHDARARIDQVRAGLRSLLKMLNGREAVGDRPAAVIGHVDAGVDYELTPPPAKVEPAPRKPAVSERRKATPVRKPATRGSASPVRRKTTKRKRVNA